MPEEKFEPPVFSADYVAALRRQLDQRVDARALAGKIIAARAPIDPGSRRGTRRGGDRRDPGIVGPSMFADPTVRAMLELPGSVWFRRATALSITRTDEDEVRLRHVAASALENWHGTAFADPDAAMDHAAHKFGVARAAWQPPIAGSP